MGYATMSESYCLDWLAPAGIPVEPDLPISARTRLAGEAETREPREK